MRRREFIKFLGGSAFVLPIAARAQQPGMPVVGYLHSGSPGPFASEAAAFVQGLKETGLVDGQNVAVEYRWAEGQLDRLPALAADLVNRHVAVIAAPGGDVTALAAKASTATIPIVFLNGSDPVRAGLVTSINQPGGNVTGVSLFAGTVDAKRLELLHQLAPKVTLIAVLNNPLVAETEARSKALAEAANTLGLQLRFLNVSSDDDFNTVFASMANEKIAALFVSGSPYFVSKRDKLVALAASQQIPAIYAWRAIAAAGGLMSYGASFTEQARQAGIYAGRILKGEKAAELPVLQPTKIEFVINLKTAKALGIEIPAKLLSLADEVIE
jgi:putative tryptophan/tyrosine transport system substrate-binding protein